MVHIEFSVDQSAARTAPPYVRMGERFRKARKRTEAHRAALGGMRELGNHLDLNESEKEEAKERSSASPPVIHEAVRREGEEELKRTSSALAWSGLAAGLSMGFSLIAEGLLRSKLPDAPWRPLVTKFGYSAGFLLVILGRQQLFTENTLTPMLPLFHRKDAQTLLNVARLWAVVLATNMLGALMISFILARTGAFPPELHAAFGGIAKESIGRRVRAGDAARGFRGLADCDAGVDATVRGIGALLFDCGDDLADWHGRLFARGGGGGGGDVSGMGRGGSVVPDCGRVYGRRWWGISWAVLRWWQSSIMRRWCRNSGSLEVPGHVNDGDALVAV